MKDLTENESSSYKKFLKNTSRGNTMFKCVKCGNEFKDGSEAVKNTICESCDIFMNDQWISVKDSMEIPKEIYLQVGDNELFWRSTSWCEDRINDNDIKYVLANNMEVEELTQAYDEAVEEFNDSELDNIAVRKYLEGYMLGLKNAIAIVENK